MLTWLIVAVAALGLLGLLGLAAAPLGLLQGPPPTDLGVKDGGLKAPSTGPNSVSGQAARFAGHPMQQATMIAPLPLTGDAATAMARLRAVVASQPARRGAARRGAARR